ncbi:MAG: L-threonylcarbamoyladenylate synthase [Chloroflexota bacterium]
MMAVTKLLDASEPTAIAQAVQAIRQGELIVFPTDTVYGVGVDAFNETAVAKLYAAKKRPLSKGIPILLADLSDLEKVVTAVPAIAQEYIERHWPGPLTLILPKATHLPANISPNQGVAVRIPDHAASRAFIRAAGGAVATSSANLSGRPAATNAAEALTQLNGIATIILDDGPSPQQMASTILSCLDPVPKIVRQGSLIINL